MIIPLSAQAFELVPCGRSGQQPPKDANGVTLPYKYSDFPHANCQLQHLFILIIRVINYLISMAAVVAIFFVLNSGFGLVFAMGNAEKIQTNKEAIQNAVVGFAIVMLAFVFVNLLVNGIFGSTSTSRNWWDPGCLYDIANTANGCPQLQFGGTGTYGGDAGVPGGPGGPAPSGDLQTLAAAVLANSNITLKDTDPDWGQPYQAKQNVIDISQGLYPAVCSAEGGPGCTPGGWTSGTVTVNPAILSSLLELAKNYRFTVISLTTGKHSAGSTHYEGKAVDIALPGYNRTVWMQVRNLLDTYGGDAKCEDKTNPNLDVLDCNTTLVNHIHWTLPFGAGGNVGGQCTGAACADARLNICGPVMPSDGCYESVVNGWDAQIVAGVDSNTQICAGVDSVKMLKAIMARESNGEPNKISSSNPPSIGLFQMKVSTANSKKAGCTTDNIDQAWLLNPANAQAQACIATAFLKTLVSGCGCDIRQLAAGYNGGAGGAGACDPSVNCGTAGTGGSCNACAAQNRQTKRWECLWDDNAHLTCNAGYSQTRVYAPAVEACYGRF